MLYKKDFKEIAEILKDSTSKKEIINRISAFCRTQNGSFDDYRFKIACGLTDEECGY